MKKTYPTAKLVESLTTNAVLIEKSDLIECKNLENLIVIRKLGEFKDRAWMLDDHSYDWQIVRDSNGYLVLVPTLQK
jgi:hypothetical protein